MTDLTGAVEEVYIETLDPDQNKVSLEVGRVVAKVSLGIHTNVENQSTVQYGTLTDIEYKVKNNPTRMYLMAVYIVRTALISTPCGC